LRLITTIGLSNLSDPDTALNIGLHWDEGVVTNFICRLVIEVRIFNPIAPTVGLEALGVIDTIVNCRPIVTVDVDDRGLGFSDTKVVNLGLL
jgi:hypothetical protein